MADYKINELGEIIFENDRKREITDPLWEEYARLEYEVLNNHHNPTKDPIKIARYNELKKYFDIKKSEQAFKKAQKNLKQKIIDSNNSKDKNVLFTAMTMFKEKDE